MSKTAGNGLSAADVEVLARVFLFEGLPAEPMQTLLSDLPPPETFEKGTVIYSGECFRRALGIVLAGACEASRTGEDGRRVLMNRLLPGAVFGAAALFSDEDRYVSRVTAATRCRVLFLPQEAVLALMRADFRVAQRYIGFLSGRIRFLNDKITGFTGGQADDRVVQYLLTHRDAAGCVVPGSLVELAASLNIGRSSLYRSLDALTAAGAIRREGKRITILDEERMHPRPHEEKETIT